MTRPDCEQLALEEYWSPSGKPTNFFHLSFSGKDLKKLNPTAKKTAIFQCESNRQMVFFVDSDV